MLIANGAAVSALWLNLDEQDSPSALVMRQPDGQKV
jgi:hypothetical protein